MKKFFWLSIAGAIASLVINFGAGFLADHFIEAWKFEQGGWVSAAIGYAMAFLNQLLGLPTRVLTFGSNSKWLLLFALIVSSCMWGVLFALTVQLLSNKKKKRILG